MPKFVERRVMRVMITAIAIVTMAASLTACARATDTHAKPVVLTTFTVIADIARAIGGDHIEVQSITKFGAEIHGYEPTPGDLRQGANADLIVENGWGLEAWFEQFITSFDAPVLTLTDGLEPIAIAADEYAGKPNPHAWMSPANAKHYARVLAGAFAELAPEHAAEFASNADAYIRDLQAIQDELDVVVQALPADQRTLVTCEGAFSYLARDAGLDEIYIWPVNAEQQATPQQIALVIDTVQDRNVSAVFCESTVSDRPMQQVVAATNADFGGTLYVDSLSLPSGPAPTYLELLQHDVDLIIAGLAEQK